MYLDGLKFRRVLSCNSSNSKRKWGKAIFLYYILGLIVFALTSIQGQKKDFTSGEGDQRWARIGDLKESGRVRTTVFCSILAVVAAVRYNVGSDYPLYVDLFARVDPASLKNTLTGNPQSKLFAVLQFLLRQFTSNASLLFLVCSLLTLIPFTLAIKRYNVPFSHAVFLYYFFGFYVLSLNAVRQSISVSFLLLALTFRSTSKLTFYGLVVIAGLFHSSAFIAIIIIQLLDKLKFTTRSFLILCLTTVIMTFLLHSSILVTILSKFGSRYDDYLNSHSAGHGTILNIILKFLIFFILAFFSQEERDKKFLMYLLFGNLVLILALNAYVIARLEPYFSIFYVIAILRILQNSFVAITVRKIVMVIVFVYFGFYVTFYNQVAPYHSWIQF